MTVQTGAAIAPTAAWLTGGGALIIGAAMAADDIIAQVDDRDVAQLLAKMRLDGKAAGDEALLAWLDGAPGRLTISFGNSAIEVDVDVEHIAADEVPARFGFRRLPGA